MARPRVSICVLLWLLAGPSGAATIDRIGVDVFPLFYVSDTDQLQYTFLPDVYYLSDGQVSGGGAGSVNRTAPYLQNSTISGSLQTLTFRRDPSRNYWTRIQVFDPVFGTGFEIELDFVSLRIEGQTGQGAGLLIGSTRLDADLRSTHASAPVGSIVPITGIVQLRDGAVFGPELTQADFSLTLAGEIVFVVPEPASGLLLGAGLCGVALRARRGARRRSGVWPTRTM